MESQREEGRRRRSSNLLSNHLIIDPIKDGSDGVKHAKHFYIDPRSRFKFW